MADLAIGIDNGVSPRADITAVQLNCWGETFHRHWSFEQVVDAVDTIYRDIMIRNLIGRAVVTMALTIPSAMTRYPQYHYFVEIFRDILRELAVCLGASIVVAVPNKKLCSTPPCIYADPSQGENFIPELIAVSAADIATGEYSNANPNRQEWIWMYGPSHDSGGIRRMKCAGGTGTGDTGRLVSGGTSAGKLLYAMMFAHS